MTASFAWLAALGFAPMRTYNANAIEWYKDYADQDGRIARVIAQFERPKPGVLPSVAPGRLAVAGFRVIAQASLPPDDLGISRAPPVMRDDLVRIMSGVATARTSIAYRVCAQCQQETAEFFVKDAKVLCRSCHE